MFKVIYSTHKRKLFTDLCVIVVILERFYKINN
jgi:hypothetical protein